MIMRTVRNQPRTNTGGSCQWSQGSWDHSHQENNWKHTTQWETEILQRLYGPPAHESTCTDPSEVCQWFRGELGESVVVRWDQNQALWHQLNLPCLEEEECCLWPQEHHPHRQTWRWKHYALGVFFCKGDRTTAPRQRDDGWGLVPLGPGHWSQPWHWK